MENIRKIKIQGGNESRVEKGNDNRGNNGNQGAPIRNPPPPPPPRYPNGKK